MVDAEVRSVLIVIRCEKHLAPPNRNWRVLGDNRGITIRIRFSVEYAQDTGPEGVGRHVHQHRRDVFARNGGSLEGGTHCDAEIGINLSSRVSTKHLLQTTANEGRPGGPTDQQYLLDLGSGEPRTFERDMDRFEGFLDEGIDHLLVVKAGQLQRQVDRLSGLFGEVFLVDPDERLVRKLLFGGLGGAQHPCHRLRLAAEVYSLLDLEVVKQVGDDLLVEVITAQMVVAMAGQHLDNAFFDPHHGHVEGPAAQIIDQDALSLVLTGFINQRCRSGFVNDPHHLQAGDLASLTGGLSLGVGEIGWDRDHRLRHTLAEPAFGGVLELLQDHRRDFLGQVFLPSQRDLQLRPHPALDRAHGTLGPEQELVARFLADQQCAVLVNPDHRRQYLPPGIVGQHLDPAATMDRDLRIGGAEIDADNDFVHGESPSLQFPGLFTTTSAGRRSSSFHENPARTTSTTAPASWLGSTTVDTTHPTRGSNGRPTTSRGATCRSCSRRSSRRSVINWPSRQASSSGSGGRLKPNNQLRPCSVDFLAPASKRSRRSRSSSSRGRSSVRA